MKKIHPFYLVVELNNRNEMISSVHRGRISAIENGFHEMAFRVKKR